MSAGRGAQAPAASQSDATTLTVGIDVADDRIEFAIAAWSADREQCGIVARGVFKESAAYPAAADGTPFRDW